MIIAGFVMNTLFKTQKINKQLKKEHEILTKVKFVDSSEEIEPERSIDDICNETLDEFRKTGKVFIR